nr:LytS/YhcK type 5TM receptor domain-containing protein [Actibacterium sp. 188UL27-1]
MGLIFGLAAVVQMYRPFEPTDGLIIDLRNIPIALAGAFLSGRAVLICVAVAVTVRLQIGGMGMWAGIAGLTVAASMGVIWAKFTKNMPTRQYPQMIALAVLASTHLLAGLVLPDDARLWFFAQAALPIFAVNVAIIPIISILLEGERRKFQEECRLKASVSLDPDNGLMTPQAFAQECAIRSSALADGSYTQALVIRLRPCRSLYTWSNGRMRNRLLAAMFLRLQEIIPHADFAGTYQCRLLLVPLSQLDLLRLEDLTLQITRHATSLPYAVQENFWHRIAIDIKVVDLVTHQSLEHQLIKLSFKDGLVTLPAQLGRNGLEDRPNATLALGFRGPNRTKVETMFHKAELLMKLSSEQRRRIRQNL